MSNFDVPCAGCGAPVVIDFDTAKDGNEYRCSCGVITVLGPGWDQAHAALDQLVRKLKDLGKP